MSDEIAVIVEAIMTYNIRQTKGTDCVVPTYTLINKISEQVLEKTIAKVTYDNWIKTHADRLDKELINFEIPGGLYNTLWNGKNHRKTMSDVVESIVLLISKK